MNVTKEKELWDRLNVTVLHPYQLNQTLFLQIYDRFQQSDITVIPVEIYVNFSLGIIDGPKYKFGQTQMIAPRRLNFFFKMDDCQHIENVMAERYKNIDEKDNSRIGTGTVDKTAIKDEDAEEDFDEGDDEDQDEDETS